MKLSAELLEDIRCGDEPGLIEVKEIGKRRWVNTMRMVFKYEDKLYSCAFDEEKCETVECETWYSHEIECCEVVAVTRSFTDYIKVGDLPVDAESSKGIVNN